MEETLEEAGLEHCQIIDEFPALENPLYSFKQGAKWQQERMYSEEEALRIIRTCKEYLAFGDEFDDVKWFEQFKKNKL